MNEIDKEKYFEKKEEMIDFIIKNLNQYRAIIYKIIPEIQKDIVLKYNKAVIPTYLTELLSKFNIYKDGKDPYVELAKLLEKYSFLEGNVCEVAAGRYPRLTELTAPKIKLNNGTLTIYEPNIIHSNLENVTIIKDFFTKDTNINRFDTIYAMYPCKATIAIAEKAFEEDKNLMLAFCNCDNSTVKYPKWDIGKYWAESFCMEYRDRYGSEAEIINWPSATSIDIPIMVRKSSKQKIKK